MPLYIPRYGIYKHVPKSLTVPFSPRVVDTASGRTIPFVSRFSLDQICLRFADKPGRATAECRGTSLHILGDSKHHYGEGLQLINGKQFSFTDNLKKL